MPTRNIYVYLGSSAEPTTVRWGTGNGNDFSGLVRRLKAAKVVTHEESQVQVKIDQEWVIPEDDEEMPRGAFDVKVANSIPGDPDQHRSKRQKTELAHQDLCKGLARWGRGSGQKVTLGARQLGEDTPKEPATMETATVEVQTCPIAKFRRKRVYVRAVYRDIFREMWKLHSQWIQRQKWEQENVTEDFANAPPEGQSRFIISGLPGLGKSVWVIYAIAMLFQQTEIHSVFFQQLEMKEVFEFTREGVLIHRCEAHEIAELYSPETARGRVLVVDGMRPMIGNMMSPVILVTSPKPDFHNDFAKDGNPKEFLMPMWTLEELKAADSFEPRGGDTIEAVIDIYGLKARPCLPPGPRKACDKALLAAIQRKDIHVTIETLTYGHLYFKNDEGSHVLMGYTLSRSLALERSFFASVRAKDEGLAAMERQDWTGIECLLRAASQTGTLGKSPATLVLEAFAWAHICGLQSMELKPLNPLAATTPLPLEDVSATSKVTFESLDDVARDQPQVLQVPKSANLEAVDAVMGSDVAFQVTCAKSHRVTAQGLIHAYQALDREVMSEEKVMRLIFVVPRSKFASFEAQEVDEGLGTDKTTPVKQGPRTKVNAKLAQYALAMDFTSADKVPAGGRTEE